MARLARVAPVGVPQHMNNWGQSKIKKAGLACISIQKKSISILNHH
jgi:hypothetical protein